MHNRPTKLSAQSIRRIFALPLFCPTLNVLLMAMSITLFTSSSLQAQLFGRSGPSKSKFFELFQPKPTVPVIYNQLPTQARLIADINARSTRIKQLENRVTLAVPGAPKITGTLQVEFPARMRLKAGMLGISELGLDAGSNDDQFWVWSKAEIGSNKPAMYFAKHAEFKNSQLRTQMPLEPKWLINAYGIISIDPQGNHEGPVVEPSSPDHMLLTTTLISEEGTRSFRRLLISTKTGLIVQVAMYDANGDRVAYSDATNFTYIEKYDIGLPQRIMLTVTQPTQDFSISVDLSSYSINSLQGDPKLMWKMPRPDNNVDVFDLGK